MPYVSVSAGVTDTVGGQTEAIISDVPSIAQMVKARKLRPPAAIQRFNRDLDAVLSDKDIGILPE